MASDSDISNRTIGTAGSVRPLRRNEETLHVEKPIGMNLIAMSDDGTLETLFLPYPAKGRYSFEGSVPVGISPLSDDAWQARALKHARFSGTSGLVQETVRLEDQSMYPLVSSEAEYMLYAEDVNEESNAFHNYVTLSSAMITIGRLEDNDLCYPVDMVSRHHAVLIYEDHAWRISDNGSANGVYVNGRRVEEADLSVGDVIYIMGLRLIIGSGFIAINDGNNRVRIREEKLRRVNESSSVLSMVTPDPDRKPADLFNRFPRRRYAMELATIKVESPPPSMSGEKLPMMMRMGSSMVMGGGSLMSGNVAMLASSLLLPVLSQRYTKEEREEFEKRRNKMYRAYLLNKQEEILQEKEKEERVLKGNYPPLQEVLTYAGHKEKLWERSKTDDDFLLLRIGSGNAPLRAKIECEERHFEMDRDELLEEMYEVTEQEYLLENVPVMLDLKKDYVLGIQGTRPVTLAFIRTLVMRLSLLYSCDEVKTVFLVDPEELDQLEFIRYLPHAWDDQYSIRFLAASSPEAYQVGEFIGKTMEEDLEKPEDLPRMLKKHPYYVIIALSKRLLDGMEVVKTAISHEKNCAMTVIAAFEDVPKESSVLIRLEDDPQAEHTVIYLKQIDRADDHFRLDSYSAKEAGTAMRILANTRLKMVSQAYALPKTLTFLEMFRAGRIEHLNIVKRWKENNPVSTLAVPVGVGTDGSLFTLDLHQKYQGPHGLVAGTTGSGKSEFLLTYILSLAINFHPDEVAFVLIDYKGGGLAGAFDDPANGIHLPHLLATITNLDGSAINRSLVSIQSEVKRRQRVFNQAKSISGEGTMDIYTYQRLYRNGVVKEAMPHLFIISDEFAELKQQEPEFLDALVSIARIGRSLGVHLILATQKPGGVVTDQIFTNTKFRVCLKVADKSDSNEMLKRPEAADLRETGRFYLQVGNNELFALGQSAWSGAAYEPQDEVVVKKDDSVQIVDHIGGTIVEAKPVQKKNKAGKSQLVEIVKTLTDLARELGLEQRSLWLPALKDQIPLEELQQDEPEEEGAIGFTAGILDDPANQKQYILHFDLVHCGHFLVMGESGGGKTTFIQSMLLSLVRRYTPQQVNFYILDYSSRLLRLFEKLPHCGAVLTDDQEGDLNAFFKLVRGIVAERKKLFDQWEVDSFESACKVQQIPLILVIIDNFTGLTSTKTGNEIYNYLHTYIKEAGNYGVRYLISYSHFNEAPSRIRQELQERVVFSLNDKYSYYEIIDCKVDYVPPVKPGRGLYNREGSALEMQLCMYEPEKEDKERMEDLKDEIAVLAKKYASYPKAERLQIISETETYEAFCESFKPGRIPLGYSLSNRTGVALPFKQVSMLSVYFGNPDSTCPVLDNFLYIAGREQMRTIFVKGVERTCVDKLRHLGDAQTLLSDTAGLEELKDTLVKLIQERHPVFHAYCEEHHLNEEKRDVHNDVFSYMREHTEPVFVVLEHFLELCERAGENDGWLRLYSSLFILARRYQIYFLAGFYPEDEAKLRGNKLFGSYNPEKMVMLFGGSITKQRLLDDLPYEISSTKQPTAYNRCLMNYAQSIYALLMPCGELQKEEVSEDDRPIFG